MVFMAKPVSSRSRIQPMEFMYWKRIGLLDCHDYEPCVCEMIRAVFTSIFVSTSRSAMTFTLRRVKTQIHLVLPADLRKLHSILLFIVFFNCFVPSK